MTEEAKQRKHQYYLANKEAYIERARKSRAKCGQKPRVDKDKEQRLAKRREYYALNRERIKESTKRWRKANREKFNAYCQAWKARNPEKVKEKQRLYRLTNPCIPQRLSNPEAYRAYQREYHRKWRLLNPEKYRATQQAYNLKRKAKKKK